MGIPVCLGGRLLWSVVVFAVVGEEEKRRKRKDGRGQGPDGDFALLCRILVELLPVGGGVENHNRSTTTLIQRRHRPSSLFHLHAQLHLDREAKHLAQKSTPIDDIRARYLDRHDALPRLRPRPSFLLRRGTPLPFRGRHDGDSRSAPVTPSDTRTLTHTPPSRPSPAAGGSISTHGEIGLHGHARCVTTTTTTTTTPSSSSSTLSSMRTRSRRINHLPTRLPGLFTFRSLSFLVVGLVRVGLFLASALLPPRQNRPRSLLATATAVIPSPTIREDTVWWDAVNQRPAMLAKPKATHQNPPLGPAGRQYSLATANPRETRAKWARHKPDFSLAKEPRMDKSR